MSVPALSIPIPPTNGQSPVFSQFQVGQAQEMPLPGSDGPRGEPARRLVRLPLLS